jgi:hypothetical protein
MIIQRYVRNPDPARFLYPGFERHVGMDGRPNAFGYVMSEKRNSDYPSIVLETLPVICMCGGSNWLCQSCADKILAECPGRVAVEPKY